MKTHILCMFRYVQHYACVYIGTPQKFLVLKGLKKKKRFLLRRRRKIAEYFVNML
jgi:hypothetical protein